MVDYHFGYIEILKKKKKIADSAQHISMIKLLTISLWHRWQNHELENKVPKGQGLIHYLMVICFFNVLEHIVSLY